MKESFEIILGKMTPILWRKSGAEESDQCPVCFGNHIHGSNEGHRSPHCPTPHCDAVFDIQGHSVSASRGYFIRNYDSDTDFSESSEVYFRRTGYIKSETFPIGYYTDLDLDCSDLMSVDECAEFLRKSANTIRKYVRLKTIPHYKKEGSVYFFKSEILKWVKDGKRE